MDQMTSEKLEEFRRELASLLNRHNIDNLTNTPDFILAEMLAAQVQVWNHNMTHLREWHRWPTLAEKLGLDKRRV